MPVNPARGTLLQHGITGTPPTYTTIAQRVSIDGPSGEVGSRETTNLDSTWKEYAPTLPDGGELSLTIQFDPASATHTLLFGFYTVPSIELWRIKFADAAATPFSFSGFVTGFEVSTIEVEGNLEASVTIKVTGPITTP